MFDPDMFVLPDLVCISGGVRQQHQHGSKIKKKQINKRSSENSLAPQE